MAAQQPINVTRPGLLTQEQVLHIFDAQGIKYVRAGGFSPVTVFLLDPASSNLPPDNLTPSDATQWVKQHNVSLPIIAINTNARAIDVKSRRNLIRFGISHKIEKLLAERVQVYFLAFDTQPDYTLVVPKAVYEEMPEGELSAHLHGPTAGMSKMPPSLYIFAVHNSQLSFAINGLWAVAKGKADVYSSPTTGVDFHGWHPRMTNSNELCLERSSSVTIRATNALIQDIVRDCLGFDCISNTTVPMLGDMIVMFKHTFMLVEHRLGGTSQTHWRPSIDDSKDKLSADPFSEQQIWHFLIVQPDADKHGFYCVSRSAVQKTWIGAETIELKHFHEFRGPGALRSLVEFMLDHAAEADAAACAVSLELNKDSASDSNDSEED